MPAGDISAGSLESFSDQGIGGNVALTALGSISTSDITSYGATESGAVTIYSGSNSVQIDAITTMAPNTNQSANIQMNFYSTSGNIQNAQLTSFGETQTITFTNE
jgi:hypothetical protein